MASTERPSEAPLIWAGHTVEDAVPVLRTHLIFPALLLLSLVAACAGQTPGTEPPSVSAEPSPSTAVDVGIPLVISADGRFEPTGLRVAVNSPLVFAVRHLPGAAYELRIVDAEGTTAALLGAISNTSESELVTYLPLRRPDGSGRLTEGLAVGRYRLLDPEVEGLSLELVVE